MDHAEAHELLELAAAESEGIERLMAGDTADAAALAGHLAGCPECTAELARVRRDALVIRDAIRSMPPPELRERTLAFVAAMGRPRSPGVAAATAGAIDASGPIDRTVPGDTVGGTDTPGRVALSARAVSVGRRVPRRLGWVAAIAAAVILSVAGTAVVMTNRANADLAQRDAAAATLTHQLTVLRRESIALGQVAGYSVRVAQEPDARSVSLSAPGGSDGSGTILYSPSTGELVAVAEALQPPATGTQMRCWVEVGGRRQSMGQMFFGGGIAYWAGAVDQLAGLPAGTRFGVSVTDANGKDLGGQPVLEGRL